MHSIGTKISRLDEIREAALSVESVPEKAALYAATASLIGSLDKDFETMDGASYLQGKLGETEWHLNAVLGYDSDNGHSPEDHASQASASIQVLKNNLFRLGLSDKV